MVRVGLGSFDLLLMDSLRSLIRVRADDMVMKIRVRVALKISGRI